jgi:hypothetical protein
MRVKVDNHRFSSLKRDLQGWTPLGEEYRDYKTWLIGSQSARSEIDGRYD